MWLEVAPQANSMNKLQTLAKIFQLVQLQGIRVENEGKKYSDTSSTVFPSLESFEDLGRESSAWD